MSDRSDAKASPMDISQVLNSHMVSGVSLECDIYHRSMAILAVDGNSWKERDGTVTDDYIMD